MSTYETGDKVRIIKKDSALLDKITTINKAIYCHNGCYYYLIDLDRGFCKWFDYDFEPYIEQPITYTIHNLINNFPTETKFLSNGHLFKIQLGELQTYDEDTQEWRKSINSLKQILDMKFTKVEYPKLKPMTFEEAVKTEKKIKYEYNNFILDDFYTLQSIFRRLVSPMYSSETVSDIIIKGTWFAEGVYE